MNTNHAPFPVRLLATAIFVSAAAGACVGASPSTPGSASPSATTSATAAAPTPAATALESPAASPAPSFAPDVSSASAAASSVPSRVAPPQAAALSEADNGRTVTVAVGASVELTLHNVYWQGIGSSDASVLAPAGAPVYSGAGTLKCIPGTGCGTVKAMFRAVAPGTAAITATRTTCGEALKCTGSEGSFKVTVLVVA